VRKNKKKREDDLRELKRKEKLPRGPKKGQAFVNIKNMSRTSMMRIEN